jgi:hypothetical protein
MWLHGCDAAQAQGLLVCLSVVEAQLQGPGVQELLTSHVLQAVTNAAEYGPCNTQLQRAPQLQAVKALAALEDKPLVAAAAVQTLRMAGIKNSSSSSSTGC